MTGQPSSIGEVLSHSARELAGVAARRAVSAAGKKVSGLTERLTDYAGGEGGAGIAAAVTGAQKIAEGKSPAGAMASGGWAGLKEKVKGFFGGGKGGKGAKGKKLKVTNIEETLDVGVPVRVAYNQWTQYSDFPSFMKKVENVEQEADEKTHWKAQVFWSHRTWEATVVQQVPDECIVWRSKGAKGHVDGAVTFHELAPKLTRILLVLEYHPQGFFERTGNLWRAQGRRARLEFKHFRRHVMTQTIQDPDSVEGWRGEIRDGEVVKDHETALREEQEQEQEPAAREEAEEAPEEEAPEEEEQEREPAAREEEEAEEEEEPRRRPAARKQQGRRNVREDAERARPQRAGSKR
ncbi:SRPBCC family protein [Dactylosporangium sp. AC04546]|uniref:SRPBCC family protein n=1 Tax=Dactylosporangium sp. AC04546 TaxID=2862460 RepID=UPI001EDEB98B|nr:SRPBCC family protein [Dactylosporangium sp. AC04546]WVK81172.1 SRPBCC family protein [Dactylosporangium sp. AC04546]